jgi:hypothetical protein
MYAVLGAVAVNCAARVLFWSGTTPLQKSEVTKRREGGSGVTMVVRSMPYRPADTGHGALVRRLRTMPLSSCWLALMRRRRLKVRRCTCLFAKWACVRPPRRM